MPLPRRRLLSPRCRRQRSLCDRIFSQSPLLQLMRPLRNARDYRPKFRSDIIVGAGFLSPHNEIELGDFFDSRLPADFLAAKIPL